VCASLLISAQKLPALVTRAAMNTLVCDRCWEGERLWSAGCQLLTGLCTTLSI